MSSVPNFEEVTTGTVERMMESYKFNHKFKDSMLSDLLSNYEVSYVHQGSFTVSLLTDRETRVTEFVGVSKQNPEDSRNTLRGRALALSRAVRALVVDRLETNNKEDLSETVTMISSDDSRVVLGTATQSENSAILHPLRPPAC